ncbi:Protein of unknown function [Tessaracoccus bendigoensis DSM 12906]|uniref:DUF3040 domain-containing protein n=1 Tax=Tessaracoccus bendigoensis DSM 12906 TaxID=1123357 RepID=A0A1M6AR44_9ACTN|nr:DUF3040 domain-containing protein [Tessaracoccus bendigoensis]SHI38970.1 Protein of unknown function [Tessaracoccus bendigoensis DSM 12906]
MALSEQERKLLEQLEASLMADDPGLAEKLSGSTEVRVHRRRAALAGLCFVIGVVVLVAGVTVHPVVSVVGFLIMLAAALLGINSWRRVGDDGGQPSKPHPAPPKPNPPPSSGSDFMEKLEERWRRRQDGDN